MMRIHIFLLCLMSSFIHTSVNAADSASSGDLAKASFVKEIPMIKGAQRLLGSSGDRLYFALKDGAVAVTDIEGKQLQTLQFKDGGDPVLKKPESVAVSGGVVYVADSELNQIAMFSAEGKYEGSFGAKKGGFFSSGGGAHELNKPRGVAVHEGIVYVLDGGSKRILMFGSNGVFLSPLDIKPSATKAGKEHADAYKLHEPVDIKVDIAGRIYVLDGEVKVYSSAGEYLRTIPWDGELSAFAVAQDGVYVAKSQDFTIQKYDFNDKLLYRFGSRGDEPGKLKSFSGLAVAKDRQVVLADTTKGMLNHYVAEAGPLIEVVPRSLTRVFVQSMGEMPVAVNKLAWNGKDTIYGIDADQKAIVSIRNGKVETSVKLKDVTPVAVAVDSGGTLWVLDKKRVLKLDATGKMLPGFGSDGAGDGQFNDTTDMVISASGKIYVADKRNGSVQIFNGDGTFLQAIRKLLDPVALAVDAQDNLYVLEKTRNLISIYSAQGTPVGSLGKEKEGHPGNLQKPVALMATLDGVSVLDGSQVKVYSRKGEYLRSFGAKGKGRGELDEPVAIALKDDVTFFVAEQKRIQTFVTQYKPAAPQHLVAKDDLHSIELNWDAVALPYVKQYQVYRSKDEWGGFVRVATVDTNRFVDRGLEVDGKYFYSVAAQTRLGFEGATSALASGTSKKYTPPALELVQVEASAWQVKMTWKPIESEFVSSYIVYQKEGNTFTKIGEAIAPEFIKEALTPNTKYTFYIAAHSSDGTDAEKFAVNFATSAFSKAPLEIEVLSLRPIFSNTYKLYEAGGVGVAKLTNNTNKDMEGVTFSFLLKDFMDFATESKLDKLHPGQSAEIKLKAVFNNNILNVTEDSSVQAMLEASYFENGKRESYSKNSTVSVYEKHKLLWDERGRYASFITPKDSPLLSFVRSVVTQYKDTKDEPQLAAALFNAVGAYGLTYIQDPTNPYQVVSGKTNVVDYVQFPRETLERKSGDCDDLVAFYTSALESMGITTRVVEVPGHMFMMFSTGIPAEEDGYNMDDMYVIYEDMLWIPVETTVVGSPFVKAWELGAANYYKWKGKGLTILNIQHAWETYKPASLAESKWKPGEVSKESIDKKFPNEISSMLKISSQTKTRGYRQQIEKNSGDVNAHLQIGIILAKLGDRQEAMKYFDKTISLQPGNAAALNNRGNLLMIDDKYEDAQKAYREAVRVSPDDPEIWINLAKAHKAVNEIKEAQAAFVEAQRLDPGIKKKYKALGLELSNTL
ncbi:MAG: Fibronectin type III domain [Gallionellaceae bacterium]|nr:MAG: Fibronectin type III domain [Gallionellaceae bacterium]